MILMIPKKPSEVTVDYLKEKLSHLEWSHQIASISQNNDDLPIAGQCSLVKLFKLNDERGELISEVVIKFAKDEKSSAHHVDRQFLVDTSAYKKEIAFYQYLLKTNSELLERHVVPPIYLAQIDRNHMDQFILILGKSGKVLDQIIGCSTEQIRLILKEWALVQSKFWYTTEREKEFYEDLEQNGFDVLTPLHLYVASMLNKKYCMISIEEVVEQVKKVWRNRKIFEWL